MEITERYWNEVRRCAEKRKIDFLLEPEEAWKVFLSQNGECAFTRLRLDFTSFVYRGTASLDRIDNDKPYVRHNVQWVHSHINVMRGPHNIPYFKKMCLLVAENMMNEAIKLSDKSVASIYFSPRSSFLMTSQPGNPPKFLSSI